MLIAYFSYLFQFIFIPDPANRVMRMAEQEDPRFGIFGFTFQVFKINLITFFRIDQGIINYFPFKAVYGLGKSLVDRRLDNNSFSGGGE